MESTATHPHPARPDPVTRPPSPTRDRVLGMYTDEASARRGVQALVDASFDPNRIEVIELCDGDVEQVPVSYHSLTRRTAVGGAVFGAVAAGIVAALIAGGVLKVPGLTLVSSDVWAVALQAALGGVLLGGILGTLIGLYSWRREPAFEDVSHHDGAVLVGVPAHEPARRRQARRAMERSGALSVRA